MATHISKLERTMEKLNCTGLYILKENDFKEYEIPQGNVIVCGVPGAFTPGCSNQHLPGFANELDKLQSKGIDKVVFISVNDGFVMDEWNKIYGHDDIDSVGDPLAVFTKNIKKDTDFGASFGIRSERYAMLVKDGSIVKYFNNPFIEGVLEEL